MGTRTVIVTGGARRIGAAICRYLHEAGFSVIIHYHTSRSAADALSDELNRKLPGSALPVQADLVTTDYAEFIQTAVKFTGRLDALVNNASVFFPTPLETLTDENWQTLMNINLKAPLFLSRAASHILGKHHGSIINISDIYAEVSLRDHLVYCMTQSALSSMNRSLACELAPDIRVNAIAPGAILWPEDIDDTHKQSILNNIPLQKTGHPLDIARSVYFLMEEATYLTGQVITIDGGRQLTGKQY